MSKNGRCSDSQWVRNKLSYLLFNIKMGKKTKPVAKAVKKTRKQALLDAGMITDKPHTNRIINNDMKSKVKFDKIAGCEYQDILDKCGKPILAANYLVCGCEANLYTGEDYCVNCFASIDEHNKAIAKKNRKIAADSKLKPSSPISKHLVDNVKIECFEFHWFDCDMDKVKNALSALKRMGIDKLVNNLILNDDGSFDFDRNYEPYVQASKVKKSYVTEYIFCKQIEFMLVIKKHICCYFIENV